MRREKDEGRGREGEKQKKREEKVLQLSSFSSSRKEKLIHRYQV
jgi:hypothetical protein